MSSHRKEDKSTSTTTGSNRHIKKARIVVHLPIQEDVSVTFHKSLEVCLDCSYCQRTERNVAFHGKSRTLFNGKCLSTLTSPKRHAHNNDDGYHPPYPGRLVKVSVSKRYNTAEKGKDQHEEPGSRKNKTKKSPTRGKQLDEGGPRDRYSNAEDNEGPETTTKYDKEGVQAVYLLEYEAEPFKDAKYPEHNVWTGQPTWARIGFSLTCPRCEAVTTTSTKTNTTLPNAVGCTSCGYLFYVQKEEMPKLEMDIHQAEETCPEPASQGGPFCSVFPASSTNTSVERINPVQDPSSPTTQSVPLSDIVRHRHHWRQHTSSSFSDKKRGLDPFASIYNRCFLCCS